MLAIGDVDFLSLDTVMITLRSGHGAHCGQISASLRFTQIHGACPFTTIQLRQIGCLLLFITDHLKGMNGTLG